MRGKRELDLAVDPPPDLAIEVDISRSSIDKLGIYADVGVPEVWFFDGEHLCVYCLKDGTYSRQNSSGFFPFLDMEEVERFVLQIEELGETGWIKNFRAWVKQHYSHLAR